MKKLVLTVLALVLVSQHSFAKSCDGQAIAAALEEHQKSGLVDPYILSYYEVVGKTVENGSLFTVVRMTDANYSSFYTVELNPKNCRVKSVN